jgi:hypothetical protein
LREEYKLRSFENRLLREIFGPKRDEAIRERRRLHTKAFHDLHASPIFIRVIK